jgi:hypothetical protein
MKIDFSKKYLYICPNAEKCIENAWPCYSHIHPHEWIEDECTNPCEIDFDCIVTEPCKPYSPIFEIEDGDIMI